MSHRASTFSRPSTLGASNGLRSTSSSAASTSARIAAKTDEYETLKALDQSVTALEATFSMFIEKMKSARDGTAAVGSVLANWPSMFEIIATSAEQVSTNMNKLGSIPENDPPSAPQEENVYEDLEEHAPPQKLVRIALDDVLEKAAS